MKEKTWLVKSQAQADMDKLCMELNISNIIARLLINRGYSTPALAKTFLNKSLDQLHDPLLMKDMDKAVKRIYKAIKNKEPITVYGDYDVDGITSTTILYEYLTKCDAIVSYYIPDRVEEGYGVNTTALENIAQNGCKLLITVDSGITAVEEIAYAMDLGMDVIVTDHHECADTIPDAYAVIDPKRSDCKYPYKSLAGVGVAFKLICALAGKDKLQQVIEDYSALAAIGTTADVMPLLGENRILVSLGLKRLENIKNVGLRALINVSGIEKKHVTTSVIGYSIAPRINAVGRVGSATRAVELFLAKTAEQADKIAEELCEANRQRREEENKLLAQAYNIIEQDKSILDNKIIILANEDWHNGIIGIASSRINERYGLPAVLITLDGDMGKGSCRSSKSPFNIYNALEHVKGYFEKFGGHMSAAGFSIKRENIDAFKNELTEYVNENVTEKDLTPKIDIDCEIEIEDINFKTIKEIAMLEPYGTDNSAPVFLLKGATITEVLSLSNDKHIRLTLTKNSQSVNAFYFGMTTQAFNFFCGDTVDIVFNLDINTYRGVETPQVTVRDAKLAQNEIEKQKLFIRLLSKYENQELFTKEESKMVIPVMDDFLTVFRYVRHLNQPTSLEAISRKIAYTTDLAFNTCKLKICLDVFEEMGILKIDTIDTSKGELYEIGILKTQEKKDLNKSKILIRLKGGKHYAGQI